MAGRPRAMTRHRSAPEDSLRLRLVVLAMVLVAMGAVVAQGAVEPFTVVSALVLAPIGYWFSYRQRHSPNVPAKVVLAVALLAAFGAFLQNVRLAASVDEARVSLAGLFLWVQVLHSFDLPRRRDLAFSAVSSLILMAEAGALSLDAGFLAWLVPYAALAGTWLFLSAGPQAGTFDEATVRRERRPSRGRIATSRGGATAAIAVLTASMLVFLATPRLPGAVVAAPPFSLRSRIVVPGFEGQVVNPGLPQQAGDPDAVLDFLPDAYPGFGEGVDLRARGRLSDRIVFRVRTTQPALWRGQVYDRFDGVRWSASDTRTQTYGQAWDRGIPIPRPHQPPATETRRVIQTFYAEARQPNVVFAAYAPREVYFPAGRVAVDRYSSIRSPILLDAGTVYSVVSDVPITTVAQLRRAPMRWSEGALERYTQLPETTTDRTVALAHEITDGRPTLYDKVIAVERWLQRTTVYDLSIPRDPPGTDPIDHFLFERRRGYCEQIASSMAVLLRAVGIPTRLVVGFGPGERNLLTGYYEVRDRDAHAWLEVLYPGVGWVPYDPTFGVPAVDTGLGDRFVAPQVLAAVGRFLGRAVPEPVKRAVGAVGTAVASAARAAFGAWSVLLGVFALAGLALAILRRRARARRRGPPPTGAAAAFAMLEEALRARGLGRGSQETPEELLARLAGGVLREPAAVHDAELVVRTFERERFSGRPPAEVDVTASRDAARRLLRDARRRDASRGDGGREPWLVRR